MKTAILVDGGFYRRRAQIVLGDISAEKRAIELANYCKRHLNSHGEHNELYRIFYYDCPHASKRLFHPFLKLPFRKSVPTVYQLIFIRFPPFLFIMGSSFYLMIIRNS